MGMPGNIDIEITTTFNVENGSVTRSVRFIGGCGLNCLVASDLGDQKWWHLNRTIVADTIELPDGQHKVDRDSVASHCSAFFEEVAARSGGDIVLSTVRPATIEEIEEARRLHEQGECPHNIVVDEKGWMYDYRVCVTCGKGLGAI